MSVLWTQLFVLFFQHIHSLLEDGRKAKRYQAWYMDAAAHHLDVVTKTHLHLHFVNSLDLWEVV